MAGSLTRIRRVRKNSPRETSAHIPAGTRILDPAHPPRRIYLLNSGRVRLSSGADAIIGHLTPGYFFGEKCFLIPARKHQTATTLSPVTVTAYGKSELLHRLQRDRRFGVRLLRNLALRIDRYEQALRDFITEPAELRLARLLSQFVPARRASGWVRLSLRPTNLELARMIGTTRWRVSHLLNHFQRLGWLSRRHEELLVRRESLREFLESPAR